MLQELPREIVVLISDFLDQIQPSSVINLACVNSNFLSICTPLLQVRTLKFSVYDDGEQLAEDILHYSELLQRLGGFRAVRRLIIVTSDDKKSHQRRHAATQITTAMATTKNLYS